MRITVTALALFLAAPVQAVDFGGRAKLDAIGYHAPAGTIDQLLGYENAGELTAQLRLNVTQDQGPWNLDAAWQLDARHGGAVERDAAVAENYPSFAFDAGDGSYFDLEDAPVSDGVYRVTHRIDRLSIAYAANAFVSRLGRQALTWGSGLVFHVMDVVNPFQPVATDTAYKPGTDMAYAQWLFEDGSDIQFAIVPHKNDDSAGPVSHGDTYAAFANIAGGTIQWNILLARDRSDSVFGVGASGGVGGTAWNVQIVPTDTNDGVKTSALANVSYVTTLLRRNTTLFAELYHNGFGEAGGDYTAQDLNADLTVRLARSQVFVTGRDYLSLGTNWEWTPLLQLTPTLIFNLHDRSALFDLQWNRSLGSDTALKAGLRLPVGRRGSEFRGLETERDSGLYLGEPTQVFVRLEYYF